MRFFTSLAFIALLSLSGCGFGGASTTAQEEQGSDPEQGVPRAPTITAVDPSSGPTGGGTTLTVFGSNFQAAGVGALVVRIDGVATSPPVIVDDATLTVEAPPGSAGTVDVEVITANGPAQLASGFTYLAPAGTLYAADGKDGVPGTLYEIDPTTGAASSLGPIGFAVNGLAVSPSGTLFATEATDFGALGAPRLLRIDPDTARGTVVGSLWDTSRSFAHVEIPDITFVGNRLLGWSEHGDTPVEINATTGVVTILGDSLRSDGDGIAAADAATVYVTPDRNDGGTLFVLDSTNGSTAPGSQLVGTDVVDGRIIAMAIHEGTLYGVLRDNGGVAPPDTSSLVTIDPSTGTVTLVGPLPDGVTSLSQGP